MTKSFLLEQEKSAKHYKGKFGKLFCFFKGTSHNSQGQHVFPRKARKTRASYTRQLYHELRRLIRAGLFTVCLRTDAST